VVNEPFVAINGDDYYGKNAYKLVAQHLSRPGLSTGIPEYCVVGYPVLGTLSEHGKVARAICRMDGQGFLLALVERLNLERAGSIGQYVDEAGHTQVLTGDEVVSMNMWGFTPAVFKQLERRFSLFLAALRLGAKISECIVATSVGELVTLGKANVRVVPTTDTWFGVTHANDKSTVLESLRNLVAHGDYPTPIWNQP
jgi:hypothetical protein